MNVKLWFRDPRTGDTRDAVFSVDLPTIPAPRESIMFALRDYRKGPDGEIHVHMKVRRRSWIVRQTETGAEMEAHVYCVDRLEDE